MPNSVVSVTETTTNVSIQEADVQVAVAETYATILLGTSGPQGAKGESGLDAINAHIASANPHPTYDDSPSLSLLFENGLI